MSQLKKSKILKEYRKSKSNRPADLSKKIMEITRAGAAIPITAVDTCITCDRADNCDDGCDFWDILCDSNLDGFWCIIQDIT